MAPLDHTKSLMAFREILELHEEEYRKSTPDSRTTVIDEITGDILEEATIKGVEVLQGDALINVSACKPFSRDNFKQTHGCQQIVNFYNNHRSVPKEEDPVPIKTTKHWTGRLVVAHKFHDEIENTVAACGITDPHARIAKWATTLSDKYNSLSEEEQNQCSILAERWNKEGPPAEVKRQSVSYH